jgi:hypothetical protein
LENISLGFPLEKLKKLIHYIISMTLDSTILG